MSAFKQLIIVITQQASAAKSIEELSDLQRALTALTVNASRSKVPQSTVDEARNALTARQEEILASRNPPAITDSTEFVLLRRHLDHSAFEPYGSPLTWTEALEAKRQAVASHPHDDFRIALWC